MPQSAAEKVSIKRINGRSGYTDMDTLAVEEPLEIRIEYGPQENRKIKNVSITMRTPGNDAHLAMGFLFTEGIIGNKNQVKQIDIPAEMPGAENKENTVTVCLQPGVEFDVQKLERHFYTTSSCGVCGKSSIEAVKTISASQRPNTPGNGPFIDAQVLYQLPEILRAKQNIFEHTGSLHACAIYNVEGDLLLLHEDVGRHNALDKLIGNALADDMLPLHHTVLLLSGRASFELLQKAVMAGIQIIAAIGAPSSMAVQTAAAFGVTLAGFLRDERFNIYCGEERILIS
jgi:FdhD protein